MGRREPGAQLPSVEMRGKHGDPSMQVNFTFRWRTNVALVRLTGLFFWSDPPVVNSVDLIHSRDF